MCMRELLLVHDGLDIHVIQSEIEWYKKKKCKYWLHTIEMQYEDFNLKKKETRKQIKTICYHTKIDIFV